MEKITIGEKFNCKFDFRETCFGIAVEGDKILLVKHNNEFSLIGGGIEVGETYEECLKREFMEESGYTITSIKELVCIDCFWLAGGKWPMESKANIHIVEVDKNNIVNPTEAENEPSWENLNDVINLLPLPYHKKAMEIYFKQINENK